MRLEAKNISFRYSRTSPWVLEQVDFAVRSGLLPASRFFTQEQLAVIYDAAQNMTVQGHISNPEQEKLLGQIMEQIEDAVPQVIDLANELTQYPKEQEPGGMRMR